MKSDMHTVPGKDDGVLLGCVKGDLHRNAM